MSRSHHLGNRRGFDASHLRLSDARWVKRSRAAGIDTKQRKVDSYLARLTFRSLLAGTLKTALADQVIHLAPRDGSRTTECCGRQLNKVDLPKVDIMTRDRDRVTCGELGGA